MLSIDWPSRESILGEMWWEFDKRPVELIAHDVQTW